VRGLFVLLYIDIDDIIIQNDAIDTAKLEGKAEGLAEGIRQVAANLKRMGMDLKSIANSTGLTEEEISSL
jgi:predicted transposase/invertase (TIGR01784 family)